MDSGNPARFPGTRNEHQPNFGGRPINGNTDGKNGAAVMAANLVRFALNFGGMNTAILVRLASDGQCSTGRSRL
jgi:hypothetical protein